MPKFVMHKHKASTLHYDFRLEISGVLKSWVIPKGPSANPADKRLAIEVEEHALSYMFFEGNIQEGKYGAGEVIIWDRGEYTSKNKIKDAYEKGHMELSLNGEKLKPKLSDSLLTTTKLQQFETTTTKSRTGKIENCLND